MCFFSNFVQVQLYEDFAKSHAKKKVEEDLTEGGASRTAEEEEEREGDVTHIFQVKDRYRCSSRKEKIII